MIYAKITINNPKKNKDPGSKLFQVNVIKKSYRIRGNLPRVQINKKAIKDNINVNIIGDNILIEKNKWVETILIAKIEAYSAMKINANGPALYSVLNPDTSSDSPSAKSKGVRLVSAWMVISQNIDNSGRRRMAGVKTKLLFRENEWNSMIKEIKIRAIETSYEMV